MGLREDAPYLHKVLEEKWTVDSVRRGTYWEDDDEDRPCFEICTTGCGCCSDTIQTLDKELAIKVAQTQVEIWKAVVKELGGE